MHWFNIYSRLKSIPLTLLMVLAAYRGLCQTPIVDGQLFTPPGIVASSNPALQGQVLARIDSRLDPPNAYASFEAWVVRENQTGTLDFYYHPNIEPLAYDPSFYSLSLEACNIGATPHGFLGYSTSVAYLLDSSSGFVEMPPDFVTRGQFFESNGNVGDEIDFFYGSYPGPPFYTGDESLYASPTLLIQTNARYFHDTYSIVLFGDSLTGGGGFNFVHSFEPSDVPEPGLYMFLGSLGVIGAAFLRHKNARKAA